MLHVDINKSHSNIIMLHVDKIYFACKGQQYANIQFKCVLKYTDVRCMVNPPYII